MQDDQLLAVVDFETTGVSPQHGARATEVGVVWVRGGTLVDQYSSLMHTGVPISPFIEQLTGISNAMLESANPAATVMRELAERHPPCPMIAHNVGFDALFWREEMLKADCETHANPERLCTVKLARKLYPQAPNCKLGTLATFHELPVHGRAHRALADALTTAALWLQMRQDIAHHLAKELEGVPVTFHLANRLQGLAFSQWSKATGAYVKAFAKGPRLC